jgi:ribonuclease Z
MLTKRLAPLSFAALMCISALAQSNTLKVTLLGTSGPSQSIDHAETGTLVQAGAETLLFDCGRGVPERLVQINAGNVNKVFLTHLHSDHTQGLPVLWMGGWNARGANPLSIWGPGVDVDQPAGTAILGAMIANAYATNTHIRRDLVGMWDPNGIVLNTTEIEEGIVYQNNGVTVTAFLVDHDPVHPAFGYCIDYAGHSVALSGDTRPSDNLVKFSQGVDVLVHEVFSGNTGPTAAYHTSPAGAAAIFNRVAPRLAVYSHIAPMAFDPTAATRAAGYNGPLLVGNDLTTITIGDTISTALCGSPNTPAITAVTGPDYSNTLSASGTVIVWGTGFSSAGGNSLIFTKAPLAPPAGGGSGPGGPGNSAAPTVFDASTGLNFWNASTSQINAALGGLIAAGQWNVVVKNACGVTSPTFSVTIR